MKCHLADNQLTDIISQFANSLDQPPHSSLVFGNKSNNKNQCLQVCGKFATSWLEVLENRFVGKVISNIFWQMIQCNIIMFNVIYNIIMVAEFTNNKWKALI